MIHLIFLSLGTVSVNHYFPSGVSHLTLPPGTQITVSLNNLELWLPVGRRKRTRDLKCEHDMDESLKYNATNPGELSLITGTHVV